ncbi:MAG: hypothetical protein ACM3NF_05855 [Gemmatimonadota bacterium]
MDGRGGIERPGRQEPGQAGGPGAPGEGGAPAERRGPTWRAWLLSILAAIVLSVAATLIFGGSFRLSAASNAAAGGCGAGGSCCPLQGGGER